MRKLSKLTQELALALEVASHAQAWGNPSPFQDKINAILLFISLGFTLYFRSIEMYSAAIGSAIVDVIVLVLWIGEL